MNTALMKPDKLLFDARLLSQRAAAPFWNAVHEASVEEITPEQVMVRVKDVLAAIPKAELPDAEIGAKLSVYLGDPGEKPVASVVVAKEMQQLWAIDQALENREEVPGYVVGPIKGGYSVALLAANRDDADKGEGLRAFLPTSQIGYSVPKDVTSFTVKECDAASGNIIVSRRSIAKKERKAAEKAFYESRKPGDVVNGTVINLVPYGAFVDVGNGVAALLHLSDISWDKHPVPHEMVQVGQTRDFQILEIDQKAKKLKVGLKQLLPDPWKTLEGQYQPGTDLEGDVVAIADFGVFLHIADGLEGLIHLSEMSWQRIKHPSHRFNLGDRVKARVLSVDKDGHRISLSTKALEQNPIEKLAGQFPVGAVLKTHISEIRDYGVLVTLDENIQGLVHIGELSWTKRVDHPSELFKEGQEIEIVVLGFDADRQRVSCSIKRTQPDPWLVWKDKYAKGTRHDVVVMRMNSHGVECDLEPGLVGFCSSKELTAEGGSGRPQDKVKIGQTINVEVTQCDVHKHSISLSVKARVQKETREDYEHYLSKQSQDGSKMTLGDIINE